MTECNHYWLEMTSKLNSIISICKFCKKRGDFTLHEWATLALKGQALNKPIRL